MLIHIRRSVSYRSSCPQYEYKMDPDVESVVCFPDVNRAIELSYGAKQLIAHEIELEKMRR